MRITKKRLSEFTALAALYFVFAVFYMLVIPLSNDYLNSFDDLSWGIVYFDYPLKALFTIPVWYLIFRVMRERPLWEKVVVNLLLLPVWVKGWQWTYYWIDDNLLDGGHLWGPGEWWDVYIPSLFYVLQFGIFHAYAYHRDLQRKERERAELGRLALESELSALKAQLNPHFLYNAFNTISASTGPGQEETRNMIARLSDLFRYQLRANREELVPLGEELDFVADYLALERERFGERLTYAIEVADALKHAAVPPLILQPLVENAVRHGISPRIAGGHVTVTAERRGDDLLLSVIDDGEGFDTAAIATGYGLANTRRRMQLMYGHDVVIDSAPGRGAHLTLQIPFQDAPPHRSRDRRRAARPQTPQGVPQ